MRLDARGGHDLRRCSKARVWLDDEEVTKRCFLADSDLGIVGLYRLDADGRKYREGGIIAKEERRGVVRIEVAE